MSRSQTTGVWASRALAAASAHGGTPPAAMRVTPLGLRPGREVYLCEDPASRVVAKCYPDDERASTAEQALRLAGGRHPGLTVPEWLRTDRRVVLQRYLEGPPLAPGLRRESSRALGHRVGKATAALHAIVPLPDRRLSRADALAHAGDRLTGLEHADRAVAEQALLRATDCMRGPPSVPIVLVHGDLGWAQLLDCGDAVGIVDFDKAAAGERELDLGNLVAQLHRGWPRLAADVEDALLKSYDTAAGDAVERGLVRGYALLTLVRKLAYVEPERREPVRRALRRLVRA
jgi:hypothetical protein